MKLNDNLIDTNIHWIGKMPHNWDLGRVKNLTYVKARIGWQGMRSDEFVDDTDWFCVTGTDFKDGSIDWSNCYCIEEWRYNQDKKIQLKIDDILITKDGTIGKVALIDNLPKKTTLNSGVFVTRPYLSSYDTKYFYWLLSSNVFKEFIDYFKNGSTILHLYQNVFERFIFPIPSKEEQTAIAQYLDTKTQAIDKKVNLLEKKIGYYKELRKSIINETVTKGLDKTVKLKDSGIHYISSIPEHWQLQRIKDIFNIGRGRVIGQEELIEDGLYPVYSSQTENNGCLGFIDTYDFDKDLLTWTTDGANAGTVFRRKGKFNCTNVCGTLIPIRKGLNLDYMVYALQESATHNKRIDTNGAKIMNNEMAVIQVTFPPLKEQTEIANYLDHKTQTIDKIVGNIQKQITTLKELRKTLINDVVTGKIKVVE